MFRCWWAGSSFSSMPSQLQEISYAAFLIVQPATHSLVTGKRSRYYSCSFNSLPASFNPAHTTCFARFFWYNNLVVVLFVLAVNLWPVVEFIANLVQYRGQQQPGNTTTAPIDATAEVSLVFKLQCVLSAHALSLATL